MNYFLYSIMCVYLILAVSCVGKVKNQADQGNPQSKETEDDKQNDDKIPQTTGIQVKFIRPSAYEITPNLPVVVEASTTDGEIKKVELYLNNALIREEGLAPYEWGTANENNKDDKLLNLSPGSYTLRADAFNDKGKKGSAKFEFVIKDGQYIAFIRPNESDISPNIPVVVEVSIPDGKIERVKLYLNDIFIRTETQAPYEWGSANDINQDADLMNLPPGNYKLVAKAFDDKGNENIARFDFTIKGDDNPDTEPPPTDCDFSKATQFKMGPMIGHTTASTAIIWAYYPNSNISVKYWPKNQGPSQSVTRALPKGSNQTGHHSKLTLEGLKSETVYNYQLIVNDKIISGMDSRPGTFKTSPKELEKTKFTYVFGSGIRIQMHKQQKVWNDIMNKESPDFIIFNGDNVYMSEQEYNGGYDAMIKRRIWQRNNNEIPHFIDFMRTYSIYGIWDDHDYGPNNSDGTYKKKYCSRLSFKHCWGNPSFGEGGEGVYTKFRKGNVDFFLVDNRFFKVRGKEYLGSKQLKWLKDGLLDSHNKGMVFKIIVHGGIARWGSSTENWFRHEAETASLLKFIQTNKIKGVIWHGGDCHKNFLNLQPMCPRSTVPNHETIEIVSSGLTYKDRYARVTVDTKASVPSLTYHFSEKGQHEYEIGKITIDSKGHNKLEIIKRTMQADAYKNCTDKLMKGGTIFPVNKY